MRKLDTGFWTRLRYLFRPGALSNALGSEWSAGYGDARDSLFGKMDRGEDLRTDLTAWRLMRQGCFQEALALLRPAKNVRLIGLTDEQPKEAIHG